jgi:hypothetical protein
MALQSQLFRGDQKLEAAATSDPAHIVPGVEGDHVRKIQLALIQLDDAAVAPDSVYGPATAAAVLAYKKKRGIVNRAYQSTADNIVGKMTMAALDKEMAAFDDERGCPECVFGLKKEPPRERLIASSALVASVGAAPRPAKPREQAMARRGDAINWVNAAIHFVRQIHGLALIQRMSSKAGLKMDLSGTEGTEQVKALKVHFKFQDAPDSLKFLSDLLETSDEAFRNAYSYAQFALHAFKKTDYRITPFNE